MGKDEFAACGREDAAAADIPIQNSPFVINNIEIEGAINPMVAIAPAGLFFKPFQKVEQ